MGNNPIRQTTIKLKLHPALNPEAIHRFGRIIYSSFYDGSFSVFFYAYA